MSRKPFDIPELIQMSLKAIKKHELVFMYDVITYLPCSKSLFYEKNLDKLEDIKEALAENKSKIKQKLRSKWGESNAPALQLAYYKLLAEDVERKALSTSYMETKQKHQTEDLSKFTEAELLDMMKPENNGETETDSE